MIQGVVHSIVIPFIKGIGLVGTSRFFSNLSFEILSDTSLKINWINNGSLIMVDDISIERSDNGVNFIEIDTVAKTSTSYTDSTISINNEYVYRLRYRKNTNYSPYSDVINVFSTEVLLDSIGDPIMDFDNKPVYAAA